MDESRMFIEAILAASATISEHEAGSGVSSGTFLRSVGTQNAVFVQGDLSSVSSEAVDLSVTIFIHPSLDFRLTEQPALQGASSFNPNLDEHNELLATKWLSSDKLAQLVQSEGLVYRKGPFSADEKQLLTVAIEQYQMVRK